ncbi:MAG: efflux RND transporter periplasmic adaptor subunit [Fusobacterium sp. JB021]|nr:efflux RND transporter periplasmic adaptor subunit [Fusobacterium sp. JB021]MDP0507046.1 efflux RND transporter periplasmic adaptor subunit [Fusobacterium sp. JB019]
MKKIILSLSLILTFLFVGCGDKKSENKPKEQIKYVKTEEVKEREISKIFKSDAVLEAHKIVDHKIEKGGTVVEILKKNGEKVKKGEIIMKLKDTSTEEEYYSTKSLYKVAENNYNKFKRLYNKKLISYLEYVNYENNYVTAKANYEKAKDNYEDLFKKAEINGIVGNLFSKIGDELDSNSVLFTIVDDSIIEAYVGFPAEWLNQIKVNGSVNINIPSINKKYNGNIVEINPIADKTTKKYMIKVAMNNEDNLIKDGMYSYITVPVGKNKTMTVSDESIFIKDLLHYVYIVRDGVARLVEVEIGSQNTPYTEISSDKIKLGDKVVVKGIFGLEDGMKVKENK